MKRWNEKLETERRRALVAQLLVRGGNHLSLRDLAQRLADSDGDERSVNRKGQPWHHTTIFQDVQLVRQGWLEHATSSIADHKHRFLAMYEELLSLHWERGELEDVRAVLKDMRNLLGTDAPQVIVYEQMQLRMTEAANRLRARYGHNPALLKELFATLTGTAEDDDLVPLPALPKEQN